jgi:DNA-binding transcriptional MerR regulator
MNSRSYSISDLTKEFAISSRTIRFYEEKGLLSPQRSKGNQRRYSPRDRFRLKWILRGKRFGYDLEEISRMLGMTDTQMDVAQQIQTTLDYGERKMQEIEDRIQELIIMKKEMLSLKEKLVERLAELKPMHNSSI